MNRTQKPRNLHIFYVICLAVWITIVGALYIYTNNILFADISVITEQKKTTSYVPNIETLQFLSKLYDFKLSHQANKGAAKRYKRQPIGGNLLHRQKQLILWSSLANMARYGINNETPTVCEIGFAYGFSAVVILSGSPTVKYVGFDIGDQSAYDSYNILKKTYSKDRMKLYWGDSSSNIYKIYNEPESENKILCDVWIIDGNHSYNGALKDIEAIIKTSNKLTRSVPHHVILWDDCDLGQAVITESVIKNNWPITDAKGASLGPTKVFTELVKRGKLEYFEHGEEVDVRGKNVSWCISALK